MPDDGLLDVEQVCSWLSVTKDWIYDQCEADRFPYVKMARHLRFEPDAIREYIADARRGYPRYLPDDDLPQEHRYTPTRQGGVRVDHRHGLGVAGLTRSHLVGMT